MPASRHNTIFSASPGRQAMAVAVLAVLDSDEGLKAWQIASRLTTAGIKVNRRVVNSLLYGELSEIVTTDSNHCWFVTKKREPRTRLPSVKSTSSSKSHAAKDGEGRRTNSRGRSWTEEETILAYWLLPSLKRLTEISGRKFSAIAMKMANLLAAETGGSDGLSNASKLDRAVVSKFGQDPASLERRAVDLWERGQVARSRESEIRPVIANLMEQLGIPLHVDTIAAALMSRNPLDAVSGSNIAIMLRESPEFEEGPANVFGIVGK